MAFSLLLKRIQPTSPNFTQLFQPLTRHFRSNAALEAISKANQQNTPTTLVLYNYPSFSGAFSALFAHLFHSHLNIPSLTLPFSSVERFRVEDLKIEGLERCYLLDFVGPKGFAQMVSRQSMCQVIAFDHRKSVLSKIPSAGDCPENVQFYIDVEKSSSTAVYEYFSKRFLDMQSSCEEEVSGLLIPEVQGRVESVLKYMEDIDLWRWNMPDVRPFSVALNEWRSRINCMTNPHMYDELLELSSVDLIAKGHSYISSRQSAASKLLDKAFKVRLGRGFYGECLCVRADGVSDLSDEIGKQLSLKSAGAGLRPIGAVVYMKRKSLKMCLRSTDVATDTSEVAKAYGGGGSPNSSSFIIRMDEYNHWISVN